MSKNKCLLLTLTMVVALSLAVTLSFSLAAPLAASNAVASVAFAPMQLPVVSVLPYSRTVAAGDTFGVTVAVSDVADLRAFEFTLAYDPTKVEAIDATIGPFLGSTGRGVIPLGYVIDPVVGTINYSAASTGSQAGPTGNGVLASVNLRALESGTTNLSFADPTNLVNLTGTIPSIVTSGGVGNVYHRVYTWTGGVNSAWDNTSNWSSGVLPTSYDDVVIPASSVANWPSVNVAAGVHNLIIQAGANLTVPNVLSVTGVVSNGGSLYQTQSANVAGVAVEFLRFQDGIGNDKYRGIVITPTADMGNVTVRIRGNQTCGTNGTLTQTVMRCYDIVPQNPAPATVRFFYSAAEANNNTAPRAYHWDTTTWTLLSSSISGGSGEALWVQAIANSYSPFTLKDDQPTAITLSSLRATTRETSVPLFGLLLALGGVAFGLWWRQRKR